ncbi:MAG: iron chaperone [Candidatus Dormibacteria bacterium]
MAEKKAEPKGGTRTGRRSTAKAAAGELFTEDERAAMQELVRERRAATRRSRTSQLDGESDVLAKIAEMPEPDRAMATQLHELIKACAPSLAPRTWYGMPAYSKGGDLICFFQNAGKFKARYGTLGFTDKARLDESGMWPTGFAIKELTPDVESTIRALLERALS